MSAVESDVAEYREERAAIGEHERGLTRQESERQADELADVYRRWLEARVRQ